MTKIVYHTNQRMWLILKDKRHLEIAKDIFKDSEIKITIEANRHMPMKKKWNEMAGGISEGLDFL